MGVLLVTRDIVSDLKSVPSTLGSWDQCMSKTYCKWPVIAAIIVASLICISIIWCLARCLCCGLTCCCSCLSCCDCFTPRSRRRKERPARFKDDYPAQYAGPAPMAYHHQGPPQFATFDVSKNGKIHADSLPEMPSWETAQTRRVEELDTTKTAQTEGVELDRLDSKPPRTLRGGNGYSQIPDGTRSPNPNGRYRRASPEYFHTDTAYAGNNADVGTQRLMNHQEDNFRDTPLSPAPTYHTNPNNGQSNHQSFSSDRFANHAASPTPRDYDYRDQYNQSPSLAQQQQQYARNAPNKYVPSISTRYEASDYSHPHSQSHTSPIEIPYHYNASPIDNHAPKSPPPQSNGHNSGYSNGYSNGAGVSGYQDHHQPYGQEYDEPASNRPPSLLQIGRKPVKGLVREV